MGVAYANPDAVTSIGGLAIGEDIPVDATTRIY
jgi:hypothetical protein